MFIIEDDGNENDGIKKQILEGDLTLFTYAATEWLSHVQVCSRHFESESLQHMGSLLSTFFDCRTNRLASMQEPPACLLDQPDLKAFKDWPEVQRSMYNSAKFIQDLGLGMINQGARLSPWNLVNGTNFEQRVPGLNQILHCFRLRWLHFEDILRQSLAQPLLIVSTALVTESGHYTGQIYSNATVYGVNISC